MAGVHRRDRKTSASGRASLGPDGAESGVSTYRVMKWPETHAVSTSSGAGRSPARAVGVPPDPHAIPTSRSPISLPGPGVHDLAARIEKVIMAQVAELVGALMVICPIGAPGEVQSYGSRWRGNLILVTQLNIGWFSACNSVGNRAA